MTLSTDDEEPRGRRPEVKFPSYRATAHARPVVYVNLGGLSKRRRQRERHQTKGLMSKTVAVHVRYKSLYISLPSSAKQRKMTKFCVIYGTWTTKANSSFFHLELNTVVAYLA